MTSTPGLLQLIRSSQPDDANRLPVLDAALDTFLEFGIRRSNMADIAKRAGISPATLYRRFADKQAIVTAVGLREVRRFLADVDRKIDHGAPADEQITALALACLDGLRNHRLFQRLLITDPEILLPALTVDADRVLALGTDYLAEFIRRLQHRGQLPGYNPDYVAELLARLALSLALTPHTRLPIDTEDRARQYVTSYLIGIFRPASQPPAGPAR